MFTLNFIDYYYSYYLLIHYLFSFYYVISWVRYIYLFIYHISFIHWVIIICLLNIFFYLLIFCFLLSVFLLLYSEFFHSDHNLPCYFYSIITWYWISLNFSIGYFLYIVGWVNNGVFSKTYWTFKSWLIWYSCFFN